MQGYGRVQQTPAPFVLRRRLGPIVSSGPIDRQSYTEGPTCTLQRVQHAAVKSRVNDVLKFGFSWMLIFHINHFSEKFGRRHDMISGVPFRSWPVVLGFLANQEEPSWSAASTPANVVIVVDLPTSFGNEMLQYQNRWNGMMDFNTP